MSRRNDDTVVYVISLLKISLSETFSGITRRLKPNSLEYNFKYNSFKRYTSQINHSLGNGEGIQKAEVGRSPQMDKYLRNSIKLTPREVIYTENFSGKRFNRLRV